MPGATKYLTLDPITGKLKECVPVIASAGPASAGLPVALNAEGQIDPSVMQAQIEILQRAISEVADRAFLNLLIFG